MHNTTTNTFTPGQSPYNSDLIIPVHRECFSASFPVSVDYDATDAELAAT